MSIVLRLELPLSSSRAFKSGAHISKWVKHPRMRETRRTCPLLRLLPTLCSIAEIEYYKSTSGQLKPSVISKIVFVNLGRKALDLRLRAFWHDN